MSTFDFDSAYDIHGEPVNVYVPEVLNDPETDIHIAAEGWYAVVGNTGQYSYRGAVMHPSETASDAAILEWVREREGTVFAIVEVRDNEGNYGSDPIGWAVIYRNEGN